MADKIFGVVVMRPQARRDLESIWEYTTQQWSHEQADVYTAGINAKLNLLRRHPGMAREYKDFDPPVRILVHDGHLIIYHLVNERVEVVRILHNRQDWKAVLKR